MVLCLELFFVGILINYGCLLNITLKVRLLYVLIAYYFTVSMVTAIYSSFFSYAIFFSIYFAISFLNLVYAYYRFPSRRKLLLIPIYSGEYHFEYANYGIGSDTTSVIRVAVLNDFSIRFLRCAPIRKDNYITLGFISGEQFFCMNCSPFFEKKDKYELLEEALKVIYALLLLLLPFLWNYPVLFYPLAIFLFSVFYLYRYIPRLDYIGIIIQVIFGLISITTISLFCICLLKGWDTKCLSEIFGGIKCFVRNVIR